MLSDNHAKTILMQVVYIFIFFDFRGDDVDIDLPLPIIFESFGVD